ncbi:Nif3-like dinuclear metal center hexameric protein [Paucilactobacillus wasatchensis]|uniref:GTP cyclohydrolase 1 type 2 homolog n=1 Tax=Paucilactobacillus wasatchensis TaxID=1335616 RepID=A0A0D1A9N4_9LACO|nr:Nif3-like dinuclear metal center hexameric protein [Paucilactobacillus wasatchensis]KIS03466.1 hypothetical protein WDC_0912 [Paucilactobacillus wasatchensis]
MIAQTLIDRFEQFASPKIAEPGDPVGLQLGNANREVKTVMTTLDVRPEVVEEAIEQQVDFIFAHHPMMFHAAHNLDLSDPQNEMYAALLRHNIVVYGAHTNLDNVNGGMNDWLAEQLDLHDTKPLLAGGTDPLTGQHYGMGRVGTLAQEIPVSNFAEYCCQVFNLTGLRLIKPLHERLIKTVAVLGGSGGQFYRQAVNQGADAYVTGDVSYHVGHDMIAQGLTVVDPGHHIECVCKEKLQAMFINWAHENDWDIKVIASQLNTDPVTFIQGAKR